MIVQAQLGTHGLKRISTSILESQLWAPESALNALSSENQQAAELAKEARAYLEMGRRPNGCLLDSCLGSRVPHACRDHISLIQFRAWRRALKFQAARVLR